MKKVIILKGLPASGKTTWAKKEIDSKPGMYKRVNKDELRAMLDNSRWSKDNEKFILAMRDELILKALESGKHVIVDDTNLASKHEDRIKQLVKGKAIIEVLRFDADVEECIARDKGRDHDKGFVGEKVIRDMYNQFMKPESNKIEYNPDLPDCIIVDVDGTLAKMVDRGPYDWARVGEDEVNLPVRDIVRSFQSNGKEVRTIIFTGRDGVCGYKTQIWLVDNGISYNEFYIRPEGNTEKDTIIKERMYREHIEGKYNVLFILDDRTQVVKMWRSLGLTCLQVADGDF